MEINLVMSRHAIEQARERGIGINEIKDVIRQGAKSIQNDKLIAVYRHIKVVFKKVKDKFFVITVMIRK